MAILKTSKIKYKGKILEVLTVGALADLLNRKPDTLRKMEDSGILPRPNIRHLPMKGKVSKPGRRLYTKALGDKLVPLFKQIRNGVAVSNELKRKIALAFQEEKQHIDKPIPPANATGTEIN